MIEPVEAGKTVEIIEVGPRDGFQGEAKLIPTSYKVAQIQRLVDSGLRHIQIASFVHPGRVPQMADAEQVCSGVPQVPGVEYSGLVLNLRGVERAAATPLQWLDMGISLSDVHSVKNVGKDTEASWQEMRQMIRIARQRGLKVRAGLQCAFGCAYSGAISEDRVLHYLIQILDEDVQMLSLADSTGLGSPQALGAIVSKSLELAAHIPLALHLHDTWGRGMANLWEAYRVGARYFDTALGGLGGCPFIPGASGNVATEDVCAMFAALGLSTGVDISQVAAAAAAMEEFLGHASSGRVYRLKSVRSAASHVPAGS